MPLTLWSSIAMLAGFSVLVVVLDEYVVKPWRHRRWERRAASGDPHAAALLRTARSVTVTDD